MQRIIENSPETQNSSYPFKRSYSLPSFKHLFPNTRCTYNYRRYQNLVIRQHTKEFNSKLVHNLSTHSLTEHELEVLYKGLNFVPTPKDINQAILDTSFEKFEKCMLRQHHFRNNQTPYAHNPLKTKSNWIPPPTNNITINKFLTLVKEQKNTIINNAKQANVNLTKLEREALKNLKHNTSIVIKACDKGGGICILNTQDYINKVNQHLNDTTTYKKLTHNPTKAIANDTRTLIEYLYTQHYINHETKEFLMPLQEPRTPLFYGLPKIHKPLCPLRPIVSGCDSPTDNLSKYITHFIQPLATNLPSYIQDTKHFLNIINDIPPLPENAILVTADVTSLYTNIPHEDGIEAVIHYMHKYQHLLPPDAPPPQVVRIILDFILKHSNFQFMEEHILQIAGTSMGTRMAPPYANLFMGKEERKTLLAFLHLIYLWKRFIDDIFFIFFGTHQELQDLMLFMNSINPTIKYTFTYSHDTVSFLDVQVYVSKTRKLETTLYKKPTDCSALLHFHSHHSLKCKESIIYSQALRYNMIISEDKNLQKELDNLTKTLLARAYPLNIIQNNIAKALTHSRSDLLKRESQNDRQNVLPIIVPYSEQGKAFSQIIHDNWDTLKEDNSLTNIWPDRPITAFQKTTCIKDHLVHTAQKY